MASAGGRVTVGRLGAAHGVRGEIRLKSYTADPRAIADYRPLEAPDGRKFVIETIRPAAGSSSADMMVVRLEGVADRSAAEALNGVELTVRREDLPDPDDDDDFYHADLIGLVAVTVEGVELGRVAAIHNHGAGDILEISLGNGPAMLVPFTKAAVPEVDVGGGRVVVAPPEEVEGEEEAP
ncbi:MAG: ribosome maturation factor RimM [Bauldia sp.]